MKYRCGIFLFLIFSSFAVSAEPWLSSRSAQNCASCHAPGRVNVESSKRRCTLSCQGCHTNPSGGGLRNHYGKWMQERWLNSGYFESYKLNKPRPAPAKEQPYAEEQIPKITAKSDFKSKAAATGFRLKETSNYLPEQNYEHRSTREKIETDPDMALIRIPDGDPYRTRRQTFFNSGIDSRFFYMDRKETQGNVETKFQGSLLMATDVAASVEPFHGFTAVVESRFMNQAMETAWDYGFEGGSQVRSAYLLADDLPYNTFAQFGLYRPLFGHYSPDHTSLANVMTGLTQHAVYKAATLGNAPGVPFFNVHLIQPMNNPGYSQDNGYALDLGARLVSYGFYAMVSYWSTKGDGVTAGTTVLANGPNSKAQKNMSSLTGGATLGRYNIVLDVTRVELNQLDVRKDTGSVITAENRFRFWRENYLKFIYENQNTARDISVGGSVNSYGLGITSFPVSSLEFEIMYKDLKENIPDAQTVTEKSLWTQLHLFF